MKLVKFIAAASLVASTFLVSGGNAAPTAAAPLAAACTNWPYCRDVEIKEAASELHIAAACTNWPYCRDVEVKELALPQQMQTVTVRKAV